MGVVTTMNMNKLKWKSKIGSLMSRFVESVVMCTTKSEKAR